MYTYQYLGWVGPTMSFKNRTEKNRDLNFRFSVRTESRLNDRFSIQFRTDPPLINTWKTRTISLGAH